MSPIRWWVGVSVGCLLFGGLLWYLFWPTMMSNIDREIAASHSGEPNPTLMPGPDTTLTFGTGGGGCQLANVARTFTTRDVIRVVSANAVGGSAVTMRLIRNDVLVPGYPMTRPLDAPSGCFSDDLPPLATGHFDVMISMEPGPLAPVRFKGGFDVTP